nr:hypothetical protein [uncultured Clostridium sp.]
MTEQELSDMFIQERINMLTEIFHKTQTDNSEQEYLILQAEIFIENLPNKERELIENYINSLINQFALEEVFLYQHGFIDGIKALKYIIKM